MVVSAFYSGLRGGRIFASALFSLLDERGHLERLLPHFDHDRSHADEAVCYALAAAGFAWQLTSGFRLPFPLDVIFLPLTIVEWFLRWQVSTGAPVI